MIRAKAASVARSLAVRNCRRTVWLAILLATLAVALTACGAAGTPSVAKLGKNAKTNSGTSSPTPTGSANANQLLVKWASCMRKHGDTNQPDPVVTANKLIDIAWKPMTGGPWGTKKGGGGNAGPGQYCRSYLQGAVQALQGGRAPRRPSSGQLLKYSECMRANGFAQFPDPSGNGGISLNVGSAMSPSNPAFQRASKLCAQRTGIHALGTGTPPPGTVELNGGGPGLARR